MNRQEKLQLHNDLKHYLRLEGDQVEFMAEHLPHAPQGQKRYIDYFVEKQDSLKYKAKRGSVLKVGIVEAAKPSTFSKKRDSKTHD